MSALEALSPLDGRYYDKVAAARECFSELALINTRVRVEVAYLNALSRVIPTGVDFIERVPVDTQRIKDIERVKSRDVNALPRRTRSRSMFVLDSRRGG